MKWTDPKVFIYKKDDKPCIDKGCNWYVYFYYRNEKTGLLQRFIEKKGINRIYNVELRLKAANNLAKAFKNLLQQGYNPFAQPEQPLELKEKMTVVDALNDAYTNKLKDWGQSSTLNNKFLFEVFIKWLKRNHLDKIDISELKKRHIVLFLNDLKVGNTSRNNYRRLLSGLFGKLMIDDWIDYNFIQDIPKVKENPIKNKPFTSKQLLTIKEYLLEHDPYLYKYILFITYAFMRPIEVNRLRICDIDLQNKIIYLQTKTEKRATIRIIEKLVQVIQEFELEKYNPNDTLFTYKMFPFDWVVDREKAKYDWFATRFKKLKTKLKLPGEYGLYSFRHSFSLDLYNKYLKDGLTDLEAKHKLMTITRHKSISGLNNYLRDIGAFVPDDYSGDYTVDF
jgi:integrase